MAGFMKRYCNVILCALFLLGCWDNVNAAIPPCSGPPVVAAINGTDSLCIGYSVTLSDNTSGGIWSSSNTGIAVVNTSGVVTGMATGVDTVKYSVTNSCGTTTVTKIIQVVSLSLAGISGPDTVCEASSITLNNTTSGGNWSSSNSIVAVVDSTSGIITGVSGGVVIISYTLPSGCFVTKWIVVNPISQITGSAAICVGVTGLFSDLSTGGTWNSSNTTVATINESTGSSQAIAPGETMITYTIPNGCSRRVLLTVNPLPPNYYVFGGGDYCAGTSGATIGLNGSDTGINYSLYDGTAFVDSLHGTGSSLFYGPYTAAGTYQIYGVNIATGCSNRMSGIATIGVIPDNVPSVSITTGVGDTVCVLANTTFTALPVDAGASPYYQWYVNSASMGTGVTYSYVPANGDVVSVVIFSDAVCAIPSTATSAMTMTTIPRVSPSISLSVTPADTVCEYVPATIIPAPVYGGPTPTYRWIKNGYTAAIGPVYTYVPANGDNILCSMYSSYECLITDSVYSTNNINMTVVPLLIPTVTVTAHPGDTITQGNSDTLVAKVVNGGTSLAYQWEINGIAVPGATNDTFTSSNFSGIDTVACVVTSTSFCGGEPAIAYIVIRDTDTVSHLGIEMFSSSGEEVRIVPNPNKGVFTINDTFISVANEATVEIADVLGQMVYRRVIPLQKGKLNAQIDMDEQLVNGVYLIRITANGAGVFSRVTLTR